MTQGEDCKQLLNLKQEEEDCKQVLNLNYEGEDCKQVLNLNHEGEDCKQVLNLKHEGEDCKQVLNLKHEGEDCKRVLNLNHGGPSKRRKLFRVGADGEIKFDEEELTKIFGFKRGVDYIEVFCGITSKAHGDYVGTLKINDKGEYSITCQCYDQCPLANVTPEEFEKHAYKEGSGRWKSNIWVHYIDKDKVPLWKTPLMKYYTHQANVANWINAANRKRNFHRDEFLRCSSCRKERRFRLRTRPEIKEYHKAFNNKSWTCSLWPYQKITCDDVEERPSLRTGRGCTRAASCQGCFTCYCKGCIKCRFEDCNCQECRDFMLYAEP